MASSSKLLLILFLSSLCFHATFGDVIKCEDLSDDICAFAISFSGKRCVLETGEATEYECRASEVEVAVEGMANYIESDACVSACGVDRKAVGISSDSLLEAEFVAKLCSPPCYNACANIVDLYSDLAAAEGVYIPDLCDAQRANPHRTMLEILSSGGAPGPVPSESSQAFVGAPAPASAPTPA